MIASVFASHAEPGNYLAGAHAGFAAAVVIASIALVSAATMLARPRVVVPVTEPVLVQAEAEAA